MSLGVHQKKNDVLTALHMWLLQTCFFAVHKSWQFFLVDRCSKGAIIGADPQMGWGTNTCWTYSSRRTGAHLPMHVPRWPRQTPQWFVVQHTQSLFSSQLLSSASFSCLLFLYEETTQNVDLLLCTLIPAFKLHICHFFKPFGADSELHCTV